MTTVGAELGSFSEDGLRVAVVGTGSAARAHVAAMGYLNLPPPVWAVGHSLEKAQAFASEFGIEKSTDDLRAVLEDASVKLVVLATPSSQHAAQTIETLTAGKDVLVEIPAGVSLAEAQSAAAAATASGNRVFVCHVLRSLPAMLEVKRRAKSREFDISQVTGFFFVPRRHNQGRLGPRNWVDDLLWHLACHQVDASLWVLGFPEVTTIAAVQGRCHERFGMAMDVGLVARTDAGHVITHSLSFNASVLRWELRFSANQDNVVFRNGALVDEEGHEIVPPTDVLDFSGVWADMLSSLATGEQSDFELRSMLPAMAVLQRAADSIGRGE